MGKEDIHISSLSGDTVNPPQLIKVARVSNEVFCGPPWYEGDFCDQCGGRKIPEV